MRALPYLVTTTLLSGLSLAPAIAVASQPAAYERVIRLPSHAPRSEQATSLFQRDEVDSQRLYHRPDQRLARTPVDADSADVEVVRRIPVQPAEQN